MVPACKATRGDVEYLIFNTRTACENERKTRTRKSDPLLLLNPAQAQAVYSAIYALSEAGGRLYAASFDAFAAGGALIDVRSFDDDRIEVRLTSGGDAETHADISAFARAYGLQQAS